MVAKEKGGLRDAHSKDKHFLNSEDVFKHTYVDVSTLVICEFSNDTFEKGA